MLIGGDYGSSGLRSGTTEPRQGNPRGCYPVKHLRSANPNEVITVVPDANKFK